MAERWSRNRYASTEVSSRYLREVSMEHNASFATFAIFGPRLRVFARCRRMRKVRGASITPLILRPEAPRRGCSIEASQVPEFRRCLLAVAQGPFLPQHQAYARGQFPSWRGPEWKRLQEGLRR